MRRNKTLSTSMSIQNHKHQSHVRVIPCHPIIAIIIAVAVITFIMFILVIVTLCSVHDCTKSLLAFLYFLTSLIFPCSTFGSRSVKSGCHWSFGGPLCIYPMWWRVKTWDVQKPWKIVDEHIWTPAKKRTPYTDIYCNTVLMNMS